MKEGKPTDKNDIGGLRVLSNVSLESVIGLLEDCPVRRLAPGDVLLSAGENNGLMYMIMEGTLGVHLDRPDGERSATLDAGQVVGEISVIDGSPVSAYVVAEAPARLLTVDEETFWLLVEASHQFATNLLRLLARRMRANDFALVEGERKRKSLEREALFDVLTGLHNRRWLDDRLPRLVRRHAFSGDPVSVLMIDVDHFKKFNDEFGHAAGDLVLSGVGRVLSSRLRPTDLSARYGGEEFTVILPATALVGAKVAAERIRRFIEAEPMDFQGGQHLPRVTVSVGVAQLRPDEEASGMLARADEALYRAKKGGRNRIES